MSSGQGLKESDSRVGLKYTDSTRGLSSKIRDSKFFRAARGLILFNPTRCSGPKTSHSDSTRGHPTYISGEATPRSCRVSAWERNISIPNNNGPSGVQDSKPPEGEGKDGDDFEV